MLITDNPAHDIPKILGMDFKSYYWAVKHSHATYLWVTKSKVVVDDYVRRSHRITILRRLCLRTGPDTKQSENPIIVTSRVSYL